MTSFPLVGFLFCAITKGVVVSLGAMTIGAAKSDISVCNNN
jgi:hypothetical protein